jgi:hypothetical protein
VVPASTRVRSPFAQKNDLGMQADITSMSARPAGLQPACAAPPGRASRLSMSRLFRFTSPVQNGLQSEPTRLRSLATAQDPHAAPARQPPSAVNSACRRSSLMAVGQVLDLIAAWPRCNSWPMRSTRTSDAV